MNDIKIGIFYKISVEKLVQCLVRGAEKREGERGEKSKGLRPGFSNSGSRPRMKSLGHFLSVEAELWDRGVVGVASNVEE